MAAEDLQCLGCSQPLHSTSKRRRLSSSGTREVISVFVEIIERKYPGTREGLVVEGSFMCQPCFRRLEGIHKLRRQLLEKERMVEDAFIDRRILTPDIAPSTSAMCTPPRSLRPRVEVSTPRRRRSRIDTPTRHAIARLQPEASPLVAVSES